MSSTVINSQTEITDVYHTVIQEVIKSMKGVFKEENISQFILQDLEQLWTTKFLKARQKTSPATLVPMKMMVPFKKSENVEIREIELMIPQNQAEFLDFQTIFPEGIMDTVAGLPDRAATMFLQQRINIFLESKDQMEEPVEMEGDNESQKEIPEVEFVIVKDEPSDQIKDEPTWDSVDGAYSSDDSSSDDSSSSQTSQKNETISIYGSDGETLNSDDDVTDEDAETLFDSDNVILCQYMKVLRCKNKWRFYFKDGVMNLDGCDYAFHKIFGLAPW